MANISDVHGTMMVKAPSKEDVFSILTLLDRVQEKWEYAFYYNLLSFDGMEFSEEDNFWSASVNFSGAGRWTFNTNISHLGHWLKSDHNGLPEEDIEYLESMDWSIIFDYIDIETNCDAFYSEIDELVHETGVLLEKTKLVEGNVEDYDINAYNLVKYEVCDTLDDAFEYLCVYDYYDETWDVDRLEEALECYMQENNVKRDVAIEYFETQRKGIKEALNN